MSTSNKGKRKAPASTSNQVNKKPETTPNQDAAIGVQAQGTRPKRILTEDQKRHKRERAAFLSAARTTEARKERREINRIAQARMRILQSAEEAQEQRRRTRVLTRIARASETVEQR